MDKEKFSDCLKLIESETPITQKEVRLNFIFGNDDFLILQGTENGLVKFGVEILKFAISADTSTIKNQKYNFGSMFDKKSELHLIDLEKVENIEKAESYPDKKGSLFSKIAFGLLGGFLIVTVIVGLITIINYLNK